MKQCWETFTNCVKKFCGIINPIVDILIKIETADLEARLDKKIEKFSMNEENKQKIKRLLCLSNGYRQ